MKFMMSKNYIDKIVNIAIFFTRLGKYRLTQKNIGRRNQHSLKKNINIFPFQLRNEFRWSVEGSFFYQMKSDILMDSLAFIVILYLSDLASYHVAYIC